MRAFVCACSLFLMLHHSPNGISQDKKDKPDSEKLQGTWKLISGTNDGSPLPDEFKSSFVMKISGDTLTVSSNGRTTIEGKFTLDPKKKPRELDLTVNGQFARCIYEIDGDKLKINHGELDTERPTEFESKPGSRLLLLLLKRE